MAPVGHEWAQNQVGGWQRGSGSVHSDRGESQSAWISKANARVRREKKGRTVKDMRYIVEEPEKPAKINSHN